MTVDPQVYLLAQARLAHNGWTYSGDVQTLAERLQETIEDFEADLENEVAS